MKKEVSNIGQANEIYENNEVVLEECILESSKIYYSITRISKLDVYDVVLIDKNTDELINFESRRRLSSSTLKYFNNYKDDVYEDGHGNTFKCISHYILYK
ncbi:MAG: hypothetical protein BZ133_01890 [Methanosphaera sp. SHI613]|nr:MAG: hypothetical protein BZ133_01890 [Methanosphaera sp. SHI613]